MHFLSTSFLASALAITGVLAYPHLPVKKSLEIFGRQSASECSAQCSGDTATLNAIGQCASNGDASTAAICICQEWTSLSSSCSSCVLAEDGETAADFQASCAEISSFSSGATGVSSASGPTSTSEPGADLMCTQQCTSSSDYSGMMTFQECGISDACLCAAESTLSTTCLTCVLADNGYTIGDVQQICAADAGSATGGSSATSTAAPANTNTAGSGGGSGGSSPSSGGSSPSPSPTQAKSAAAKLSVGGRSALVAGVFAVVGGLMAML